MTTLVTGKPQNSKAKLVRLLNELVVRRNRVWEHPQFGGVNPKWHIPNSKHVRGRAGDINRFYGQRDEDDFFDHLAVELMQRGWGVIWNRGRNDHEWHLHVETIIRKSENYRGRVRRKRSGTYRPNPRLVVDGIPGNKTVTALQRSMGTYVDGDFEWGGQCAKALQAFLNTELNAKLVVDGKFGRKSTTAIHSYFNGRGSVVNRGPSKGQWMEIQRRLNARGNIATPV